MRAAYVQLGAVTRSGCLWVTQNSPVADCLPCFQVTLRRRRARTGKRVLCKRHTWAPRAASLAISEECHVVPHALEWAPHLDTLMIPRNACTYRNKRRRDTDDDASKSKRRKSGSSKHLGILDD